MESAPSYATLVAAGSPAPSFSSTTTTTTTATPHKKRKVTGQTGSRGVANLNPEQLAKKRANDREAQRAIRERTKGQIEQLEKRIEELTAQKPYQELQDVVRQKGVVEAENEDIRRRLANVMSILQPICGGALPDSAQLQYTGLGIQNPVLAPESISPVHGHQPTPPIGYNEPRSATSASSVYAQSPQDRPTLPPSPYTSGQPGFSPVMSFGRRHGSLGQHSLPSRSPMGDEKLELIYLLRQSRQNSGEQRQHQHSVETTPSVHSLNHQLPMHTLSPIQHGFGENIPVYAHPPRNIIQTCPLDGLLLKFLSDQRERALLGVPTQELIGPPYPDFGALIDPSVSERSHALSSVFTEMLGKFPDISTLPEQTAILYIMFIIMRWQIHPTQETYDRLPDWITPRPSQLFTPHPAWVDHLPWPKMRDKLTRVYSSIPFDEFFIPYTTTVCLNWPFEDRDVLMTLPDSEDLVLNPQFERHLRDLGNWTLGDRFARAHPQLADTFKIAAGGPKSKNM